MDATTELHRVEVFHSEKGDNLRSVKVLVETGGVEITCYGIRPRGGYVPGTGCGFTATEWAEVVAKTASGVLLQKGSA